jgi:hypothetical protein
MTYSFTNIRWIRVINTSLITIAFCYFSLILITTCYAFILALQVGGKPDQSAISHFAGSTSKWLMPLFEIVFTFTFTLITSKKIEKELPINGLIIGILVGIFGVFLKMVYGGVVTYYTIALFLIVSLFGYLGGVLVQKRRESRIKSPA